MPLDTLKTTLQVEGQEAVGKLRNKLAAKGPVVLYHGSLAAAAATAVGHFPWFYTYNSLQYDHTFTEKFRENVWVHI